MHISRIEDGSPSNQYRVELTPKDYANFLKDRRNVSRTIYIGDKRTMGLADASIKRSDEEMLAIAKERYNLTDDQVTELVLRAFSAHSILEQLLGDVAAIDCRFVSIALIVSSSEDLIN